MTPSAYAASAYDRYITNLTFIAMSISKSNLCIIKSLLKHAAVHQIEITALFSFNSMIQGYFKTISLSPTRKNAPGSFGSLYLLNEYKLYVIAKPPT